MAIYHYSAQIISRKSGKSVVASAAYRAGEKLHDDRIGVDFDYTKRQTEIEAKIYTPENVPEWVNNREKLWNEVEKSEKRNDSQLAREINVALPIELSKEQNRNLIDDYVSNIFVDKGMIADVAIHWEKENPHSHILLTTREITKDGFGKKQRDWNPDFAFNKNSKSQYVKDTEKLIDWRAEWANFTNKHLAQAQAEERIDHRSYKEQNIEKIPTRHMGVSACHMENKGIKTEIGELNRQIKEFNKEKIVELEKYKKLAKELEEAKNKIKYKKYKFKYSDDLNHFRTIREYKKDFKEAVYMKKSESKAIFNLNTHLGKKLTVDAIYQMYSALVKTIELDRKLEQEIEKVLECKKLVEEKSKLVENKQELSKGIFSKLKNKENIQELDERIKHIEFRIKSSGIDVRTIESKKKSLEESKLKNEKLIDTFRKTAKAKKAIEDTKIRARSPIRNRKRGSQQQSQTQSRGGGGR